MIRTIIILVTFKVVLVYSHRILNWFFHFKVFEQIFSPWENTRYVLRCSSYSCVTFILTFLSLNKFSVEFRIQLHASIKICSNTFNGFILFRNTFLIFILSSKLINWFHIFLRIITIYVTWIFNIKYFNNKQNHEHGFSNNHWKMHPSTLSRTCYSAIFL